VRVAGLPAGVPGQITVAGPNGFARAVTKDVDLEVGA